MSLHRVGTRRFFLERLPRFLPRLLPRLGRVCVRGDSREKLTVTPTPRSFHRFLLPRFRASSSLFENQSRLHSGCTSRVCQLPGHLARQTGNHFVCLSTIAMHFSDPTPHAITSEEYSLSPAIYPNSNFSDIHEPIFQIFRSPRERNRFSSRG